MRWLCRWYVVGEASSGMEPRVIANTDTETMQFVQSFDDDDDTILAGRRHKSNVQTVKSAGSDTKLIIPTPLKVDRPTANSRHMTRIDTSWTVVYDDHQLRNEADFIASQITRTSNLCPGHDILRRLPASGGGGDLTPQAYLQF